MAVILWIFNIGYLCQHLGTVLQINRIEKKESTEGVSVDTQILFLIGAFARLIWVRDTMLKDFWLTYLEILLALTSLVYTLYICLFKYNGPYTVLESINKSSMPIYIRWYVLFIACAILSYFIFPGNEGQKFDLQMFVSLNMFTEAAGLLPQIYTVNKERDSNNFSSLYLIFLSFSRVLRLIFWIKMYMDNSSFIFLMIADIIHLFMVSGFVYSFFKNLDVFALPTDTRSGGLDKKMF